MDDQLERATDTQSHGCKVTQVARCQAKDAEVLGERHDRSVHEAQAAIRIAPVDLRES